jgi:hypothetical protein
MSPYGRFPERTSKSGTHELQAPSLELLDNLIRSLVVRRWE